MLEQNQHFSRRIVVHSVRKDVVDVDGGSDTHASKAPPQNTFLFSLVINYEGHRVEILANMNIVL